jgi:hypothetical protein
LASADLEVLEDEEFATTDMTDADSDAGGVAADSTPLDPTDCAALGDPVFVEVGSFES